MKKVRLGSPKISCVALWCGLLRRHRFLLLYMLDKIPQTYSLTKFQYVNESGVLDTAKTKSKTKVFGHPIHMMCLTWTIGTCSVE